MTSVTETLQVGEPAACDYPPAPLSLADTGLPEVLVEDMVLKLLLSRGSLTGREAAEVLCLPFPLVSPILADLKQRLIVAHRNTAALGDFYYTLTESGKTLAVHARESCGYVGPMPVIFEDYLASVAMQTIREHHPSPDDLKRAFGDIILDEAMLTVLGPAINSGRGIFLYGEPGNGKTTIAERIRDCFGDTIFIPKALWIEGVIVQLFDPQTHQTVNTPEDRQMDTRWVEIRRPMVMVGGELTLESLELAHIESLNICEAPLQMKANGGVFLIDDFGRQRVDSQDLLNRWIVPLEKRFDFLTLPNGKKIQVPFDELILFSTNLNPKDLVDEAFLRRIPYKLEVPSPNEATFRKVFAYQCARYDMAYDDEALTYLIQAHYVGKRSFRLCHARDLLDQVRALASYEGGFPRMTQDTLDIACRNYFSALG